LGSTGSRKVTGAASAGKTDEAGCHEPEDLPAMRGASKCVLEAMSEEAARISFRKANFQIWVLPKVGGFSLGFLALGNWRLSMRVSWFFLWVVGGLVLVCGCKVASAQLQAPAGYNVIPLVNSSDQPFSPDGLAVSSSGELAVTNG
jgi:hypothetical protein